MLSNAVNSRLLWIDCVIKKERSVKCGLILEWQLRVKRWMGIHNNLVLPVAHPLCHYRDTSKCHGIVSFMLSLAVHRGQSHTLKCVLTKVFFPSHQYFTIQATYHENVYPACFQYNVELFSGFEIKWDLKTQSSNHFPSSVNMLTDRRSNSGALTPNLWPL